MRLFYVTALLLSGCASDVSCERAALSQLNLTSTAFIEGEWLYEPHFVGLRLVAPFEDDVAVRAPQRVVFAEDGDELTVRHASSGARLAGFRIATRYALLREPSGALCGAELDDLDHDALRVDWSADRATNRASVPFVSDPALAIEGAALFVSDGGDRSFLRYVMEDDEVGRGVELAFPTSYLMTREQCLAATCADVFERAMVQHRFTRSTP